VGEGTAGKRVGGGAISRKREGQNLCRDREKTAGDWKVRKAIEQEMGKGRVVEMGGEPADEKGKWRKYLNTRNWKYGVLRQEEEENNYTLLVAAKGGKNGFVQARK